ncbi:HAD family hydrolase [Candidatus Vidania fulgoroideorum]
MKKYFSKERNTFVKGRSKKNVKVMISVFDLDKTIIKVDCEGLFYKVAYVKKIISSSTLREFFRFQEKYKNGKFEPMEHLEFQNKVIIKYKLRSRKGFLKYFISKYLRKNLNWTVYNEMLSREVVLISTASNHFLASKVNKYLLGSKNIICTSLDNPKRGYLPINYGIGKCKNLDIWIKKNNYKLCEVEFFTDSINDLPLLLKANRRFIVNPDVKLIKKSLKLSNRIILFTE